MKAKLIIILALFLFSSCRLSHEFIPTNYSHASKTPPDKVKLYLTEQTIGDYKDIGLIRLRTYNDNMTEIIGQAKKIASDNGGNGIIYKQTSSVGRDDYASYYIFEFIVAYKN